jgi:hypothetical protein
VARSPQDGSSLADVVRRLPVGELGWDDLVLPQEVVLRLRALVPAALPGGLVVALHGAAGVGKTFAVRVWAEAMRVDLWRVDCRALVDRHGSAAARRGLEEVLPLGERPHAILLFDHAEALVAPPAGDALEALLAHAAGRRAPTALELRDDVLELVVPRLPVTVELVALPFPDAEVRRRLWETLVARASPLAQPDLDALAELELPGAAIDAALRRVVAEHGDERLSTDALVRATRAA